MLTHACSVARRYVCLVPDSVCTTSLLLRKNEAYTLLLSCRAPAATVRVKAYYQETQQQGPPPATAANPIAQQIAERQQQNNTLVNHLTQQQLTQECRFILVMQIQQGGVADYQCNTVVSSRWGTSVS